MFARKFMDHMDNHAERLSRELVQKIDRSGKCVELLRRVPPDDQKETMRTIYQDLTKWLLNERALDEQYYITLGSRRAQQDVPFSDVTFAVCAARDYFWEYIERETLLDQPADFWGGVKLLRSLDSCFDRALCYAALGYQENQKEHLRATAAKGK